MNTKIHVDNLATAVTADELRQAFSAYGKVAEVTIPIDRTLNRPRGFAFVTMATPEGARLAIRGLNGKAVGSSTLNVSQAWPQEERLTRPGGG